MMGRRRPAWGPLILLLLALSSAALANPHREKSVPESPGEGAVALGTSSTMHNGISGPRHNCSRTQKKCPNKPNKHRRSKQIKKLNAPAQVSLVKRSLPSECSDPYAVYENHVRPDQYYVGICVKLRPQDSFLPDAACNAVRLGFDFSQEVEVEDCRCGGEGSNVFTYYYFCPWVLFSTRSSYPINEDRLRQQFDPTIVPNLFDGNIQVEEVNLCRPGYNLCDINSWCTSTWGNYECRCRERFDDLIIGNRRPNDDDSDDDDDDRGGRYDKFGPSFYDPNTFGPNPRPGTRCRREQFVEEDDLSPIEDLDTWQWILVGLVLSIILLLLICCGVWRTPYGHRIRKRVRHIKVFHAPPQPPPPQPHVLPYSCGLGVPEAQAHGGRVNLFVDDKDEGLRVRAKPNPYGEIDNGGHSAFIANSGFDGQVYVADEQPGWANSNTVEYVTQPQAVIGQQQIIGQQQVIGQQQIIGQPQILSVQPDPIYSEPQQFDYGGNNSTMFVANNIATVSL